MEDHDAREAQMIAGNLRRELGLASHESRDVEQNSSEQDAAKRSKSKEKNKDKSTNNNRLQETSSGSKRRGESQRQTSREESLPPPTKKSRKRASVILVDEVRKANGGMRTSDLLAEHLWPDDFTREKLDSITLEVRIQYTMNIFYSMKSLNCVHNL